MSTQQIPTLAQLDAARKILWHQGTAPAPSQMAVRDVAEAMDAAPELARAATEPRAEGEGSEEDGSAEREGDAGSVSADADASADEMTEAELEEGAGPESEPSIEMADGELAGADAAADEAAEVAPVPVAVRTMEAARALVEQAGLMPFLPHTALAAAPMPSFVEATLGEAKSAPTAAESGTARSLLARLVAEGSVVPLNLLGQAGTTGESPDFVASASAFPYVFTLRGDKAWKQLPETSGANKVSPLAVNTYALLSEHGPQSAYVLTGELGKGLTEAAVVRALTELWQQLRVIPVPQSSGKPTLWEPITSRLLRQVKAGANAGQPTALSALISLYLGQAVLATEDEVEVFLSTVAPRSRVRDVVHALMAAQELETMAIAGKQHVYVAGALPEFSAPEAAPATAGGQDGPMLAEDGSRIRRMVKGTRPEGERAKPFRPAGERGGRPARPEFGSARGARPGAARGGWAPRDGGDRGGRAPFAGGAGRPERPARFDRPWEENKRPSRPGAGTAGDVHAGAEERGEAPRSFGREGGGFRPQGDRPRRVGGDRPAFGRRAEGGFGGDRPRPSFDRSGPAGERPRFGAPRFGAGAGGPRRDGGEGGFAGPRGDRGEKSFGGDGERRPFRPAGGDRPRGGFGGDRPTRGGPGGPRRDGPGERAGGFGGERGPGGRPGGFKAGGFRPAGPRPGAGSEDGAARPPFRRFDAPREGDRPFRPRRAEGAEGGARGFGGGDRPSRPAGRREFPPRAGGSREEGARPFRPAGGARFAAGGAGDSRGPKRPFARREGGDAPRGARPGAGAERGGGAGAGPFDKFKDGNKPWGKRPPKRKIKPEGGEG